MEYIKSREGCRMLGKALVLQWPPDHEETNHVKEEHVVSQDGMVRRCTDVASMCCEYQV